MQGKNRTFSILSNTVDKKRSTQSNPGNPVSPRKVHPFIALSLPSSSPSGREKAKKIERLRLDSRTVRFP